MVYSKLIIDGNAVYEIDEECMERHGISLEELEKNVQKSPCSREGQEE